jgi:hypothetical protein
MELEMGNHSPDGATWGVDLHDKMLLIILVKGKFEERCPHCCIVEQKIDR